MGFASYAANGTFEQEEGDRIPVIDCIEKAEADYSNGRETYENTLNILRNLYLSAKGERAAEMESELFEIEDAARRVKGWEKDRRYAALKRLNTTGTFEP